MINIEFARQKVFVHMGDKVEVNHFCDNATMMQYAGLRIADPSTEQSVTIFINSWTELEKLLAGLHQIQEKWSASGVMEDS